MSNEQILSKLKSEKDNKVTKAVEDAAATAMQMDIIMVYVNRIVSQMGKSERKCKLLESLKHLHHHWSKMKAFICSSADVSKWKSGKSLAMRKLNVEGIVLPKTKSKNAKMLLDRSIKNMNRLIEDECSNKENIKPRKSVKVKTFRARTKKMRKAKVKKPRVWRFVRSKTKKGEWLKIPSAWGEPTRGDEYTPREVLEYVETRTPSQCMTKFVRPLVTSGIIPVSYDAVKYVQHLHRSLLVS
jgi:hypothetical protein